MQELDFQIGKRLQKARKDAGFRSARAFARHYNIPESTYSQHETGKRSLNPRMVRYYCECFNVDANWLILDRQSDEDSLKVQQKIDVAILQKALQEAIQKFSKPLSEQQIKGIISYSLLIYKNVISAAQQV
ncbi:MAG: helix-turn-helix domain-containing protein [Gammaproteobacteria bacterium]|nr:helix-turn-helix domain-containing protein [Gammaproteobacteria bacterium]MCH9744400.1 helix-turn-helix domain-containing protein [Gammaproteobacteria bacterium]